MAQKGRAPMGTELVEGPQPGRVLTGVNAWRPGEILRLGGARYRATGLRTGRDYWEAVYVRPRKARKL